MAFIKQTYSALACVDECIHRGGRGWSLAPPHEHSGMNL